MYLRPYSVPRLVAPGELEVLTLNTMEEERMTKKNWKGRDEEKDPGKDGEKKWKEIFKFWE
jgi:hypothetical protein